MRHIVLTQEQRDWIMSYRDQWLSLLESRNVDFFPVEIKNLKYILPEKILSDPAYAELVNDLNSQGHLNGLEIREVTNDELIVYDIN